MGLDVHFYNRKKIKPENKVEVINFFNYSDSDYANDKPVTKEQLEKARILAEKTIKMVIKPFY